MKSGVASRPIEDLDAYRRSLSKHVTRSGMFMQPVVNAATNSGLKLVYSDAENEIVLRAVQTVVDEAIARPMLVGRPDAINELIDALGLRIKLGEDVDVINPRSYDKYDEYSRDFHSIAGRGGVSVEGSSVLLRTDSTMIAAMALRNGDADGMICGKVGRFADHFETLRSVIGTQGNDVRASTLTTLLFDDGRHQIVGSLMLMHERRYPVSQSPIARSRNDPRIDPPCRKSFRLHHHYATP